MNKKWNILVADDETMVRTTLKEVLEEIITCRVHTASDGLEALETVHTVPLDCCFVDIRMPRLDGLELIEKIKEYDNTIPVVIITGHPSLDLAIDAMRRGASDFLVKPFSVKDVTVTFKRVTKERALLIENIFLKEEIEKKQGIERLNVELQHKIQEATQLNEVMQELFSVRSSDELFQRIVDIGAKVTASETASFMLLDRESNNLIMIAATPSKEEWIGKATKALGDWVAGKVAKDGVALLVKDASALPPEVANSLREKKEGISFISLPLKIKNEVFGVLNCTDKKDGTPYSEHDLYFLDFLAQKASLTIENLALYESLSQNLFATLYTLVETIEARDPYTREHSRRVTDLSVKIAKNLGCSDKELELLTFAGYLHDIGKIGVRDNILLKESGLTDEENDIIKIHPVMGANIIKHLGFLHREQAIIRHHHEHWDGKGYPDGLKGDAIPLLSRVIAVADAFDAMTSDRPYRKAKTKAEALSRIKKNAGTQFDKRVVDAFDAVLKDTSSAYDEVKPDEFSAVNV
ncbi:MAG: response regulator [Deltaproteobacteria bacterium]|nr:response regulator [Deltaproteobacteria bacterium]